MFSSPGKRTLVLSLALVLLTVLVYYPIRNNAFINFDDNHYITDNSHIRSGLNWNTVKWAFTSYQAANWHPLTWLSHALDVQLFGLNPAGHHFVNVLLHACNAVLLFLVLQSLTGFSWRSLMVAAIFAVHPLNVESVAWAAERKNLLSTLFFLLALWSYLWYVRKPNRLRFLTVGGLFAFGLMSKPQIVTLPFVLLLLDYWPLQRVRFQDGSTAAPDRASPSYSLLSLLKEKVPLLLLSALSAFITLQAQRTGHAVRTIVEYSFSARLENAIASYVRYLGYAFFPWHLAPIYPHPGHSLAIWKVIAAAAVLVAITVLVARQRNRRYLLVGWLWFLGTLVPMIGLLQVGMQGMADRYMYVSILGIFLPVVWCAAEAFHSLRLSAAWAAVAGMAVLTVLSAATYRQIGHWQNSESLWSYTLRVTQGNFMAEDNLAQELAHQGRTQEALVHFHRTLNMYNWGSLDLIAFGVYEQRHGYTLDAIKQYERAAQNAPDQHTQSIALSNIGSAYMDLKDQSHAKESFEAALDLDPKNVPALIGTGLIAEKSGNDEVGIGQYEKALSIAPTDLEYALVASAYEHSGKRVEAQAAYQKARELSPDFQNTRATAEHLLAP